MPRNLPITSVCAELALFCAPFLYVLAAALLCSLLAYPVHILSGDYLLFHKIINRGSLLLLVLGIYPLTRILKLRASQFGFCGLNTAFLRKFAIGLAIGIFILSFVAACFLALEVRIIDWSEIRPLGKVVATLGKSLAIGVMIASMEEPVFRGLLLGGLLTRAPAMLALNISAFYYALLHFFKSSLTFSDSELNWLSGFRIVIDSFSAVFDLRIIDSFASLFFAGIFLGLIQIRLKCALGYCIGLHAGWVFIIKTTKTFTDRNLDSPWSVLVGNYDGIIGLFSSAWLILLIAGLFLFFRDPAKFENPS